MVALICLVTWSLVIQRLDVALVNAFFMHIALVEFNMSLYNITLNMYYPKYIDYH